MSKLYKVLVTERHTDTIDVEANSPDEARDLAMQEAECSFECVYDCEILQEGKP